MASGEDGLVTVAYAPSEVRTKIGSSNVVIDEETEYPFQHSVRFAIHAARPTEFALRLRIPGWADGGSVTLNGKSTFFEVSGERYQTLRRTWRSGDSVLIEFRSEPRVTHWFHDSAVFEYGPLVFSLPLEARWTQLKSYAEKSADWQLESKTAWNYSVVTGACDASVEKHAVSAIPFDVRNPAISLRVKGRLLPGWGVNENSAGPVPVSPVQSAKPLQELTLVPYGAAKLRVTAFPFLEETSKCK
jgi:hypothetical protein